MGKIPDMTAYGAFAIPTDIERAKKDVINIVKNTGTFGSPAYVSSSRHQTLDGLPLMLVGIGIPITYKRVFTVAEVKALNTVPIAMVAAPGAGYFIDPISATYQYDYQSAAYNGATGDLNIIIDTAADPCLKAAINPLALTNDSRAKFYIPTASAGALIENKGLKIQTSNDSTTGDSILTVWVTFIINSI